MNQVVAPVNTSAILAGNLGYGGVGPLADYAQVLKLIANEGRLEGGERLLSVQAMRFLQAPSTSDAETPLLIVAAPPVPFLRGAARASSEWGFGAARYNPGLAGGPIAFPLSSSTLAWSGAAGTQWVVDIGTGYYMVQGTNNNNFDMDPAVRAECVRKGEPDCQPDWLHTFGVLTGALG